MCTVCLYYLHAPFSQLVRSGITHIRRFYSEPRINVYTQRNICNNLLRVRVCVCVCVNNWVCVEFAAPETTSTTEKEIMQNKPDCRSMWAEYFGIPWYMYFINPKCEKKQYAIVYMLYERVCVRHSPGSLEGWHVGEMAKRRSSFAQYDQTEKQREREGGLREMNVMGWQQRWNFLCFASIYILLFCWMLGNQCYKLLPTFIFSLDGFECVWQF